MNIIAPWFVLLMMFVFLVILVFMAFGVKGESITDALKDNMSVPWAIVALGIIIVIFAFSQVYGAQLSEKEGINETANTFNEGVKDILFHPKMLGAVFLLVIGALAVRLLTMP
jgi:NADH:ubiquinone oxidoreductase subunit 6 (subunit J)